VCRGCWRVCRGHWGPDQGRWGGITRGTGGCTRGVTPKCEGRAPSDRRAAWGCWRGTGVTIWTRSRGARSTTWRRAHWHHPIGDSKTRTWKRCPSPPPSLFPFPEQGPFPKRKFFGVRGREVWGVFRGRGGFGALRVEGAGEGRRGGSWGGGEGVEREREVLVAFPLRALALVAEALAERQKKTCTQKELLRKRMQGSKGDSGGAHTPLSTMS